MCQAASLQSLINFIVSQAESLNNTIIVSGIIAFVLAFFVLASEQLKLEQ